MKPIVMPDLRALKAACRILTRFPLAEQDGVDLSEAVPFFPAIGALFGLCMWLIARVLVAIAGQVVGSIIGAVFLPLLLWWGMGWRNLAASVWLIEKRLSEHDALPGSVAAYALYWRVSMFHAFVLLRWLCVGGLIYQKGGGWLLSGPVLSSAAFVELCRPKTSDQSETNRAPAPVAVHLHWLIAAVVVLVASGLTGALFAGLTALVCVYLLVPWAERSLCSPDQGTGEQPRRALMELIEQGVLLIGILYLLT